MKYRADIDGLRALAVLAVVQFHLSLPWLADGGYVGVDIFFVISGYLITGIIFESFARGTYSISDFYFRRIRRIFPALFVVYLAILAASVLILFPSETENIGKTILSSIFFVSNIFFSGSSNYFDLATKNNPALHTWSLSVEEQFYIFFPLFLFAIGSFSLRFKKFIILIALFGLFALSAWWLHISPTDTFYLVQYRAWELLVGSALAIGAVPKTTNKFVVEIIAATGLAAIVFTIFTYTEATPFPGLSAALPCLGSAALIYAGSCHQGFVSRLMSLEPLRRIGQMSYSMYLWHWPMIVFYAYLFPFRNVEKIGLLAAIFIVSYLSWRFIEQPFRHSKDTSQKTRTFVWAGLAMAGAALLALNIFAIANALRPISPQAEAMVAALKFDSTKMSRVGICFLDNTNSFANFKKDTCLKIESGKSNVLIMGDSHAGHLYAGYVATFPSINFLQATASGCKPMANAKGAARCLELQRYILNEFLPSHHLDTIILSSQWTKPDIANALALATTLKTYADHIVISGPIVEYRQSLPRILANAIVKGESLDQYAEQYRSADQALTDAEFKNLSLPEGVTYVSPYSALCTPVCKTQIDSETPLQFDYGHLTEKGSIYLAHKIGAQALGISP
jgi:peptidoglycan/LPS O-acetylase OafA/YrhL